MFNFAVQIEPSGPLLHYGSREVVARRLATSMYDRCNHGRMNTQSVLLLAYGAAIDRFANGLWMSGYVEDED
jgi:hypothetical protein